MYILEVFTDAVRERRGGWSQNLAPLLNLQKHDSHDLQQKVFLTIFHIIIPVAQYASDTEKVKTSVYKRIKAQMPVNIQLDSSLSSRYIVVKSS